MTVAGRPAIEYTITLLRDGGDHICTITDPARVLGHDPSDKPRAAGRQCSS